jgi:hypothetical protein
MRNQRQAHTKPRVKVVLSSPVTRSPLASRRSLRKNPINLRRNHRSLNQNRRSPPRSHHRSPLTPSHKSQQIRSPRNPQIRCPRSLQTRNPKSPLSPSPSSLSRRNPLRNPKSPPIRTLLLIPKTGPRSQHFKDPRIPILIPVPKVTQLRKLILLNPVIKPPQTQLHRQTLLYRLTHKHNKPPILKRKLIHKLRPTQLQTHHTINRSYRKCRWCRSKFVNA